LQSHSFELASISSVNCSGQTHTPLSHRGY
jgi:hypothetical protein